MTTAYSYIRFSSEKQELGDSLRRQTEAAAAYAKANGFTLDESTTIKDLGLSAYHGKHLDGELGAFLKAIETGKIQTPCHLLIENLDRLSRLPVMDGVILIGQKLLQAGVTIHVISQNRVLTDANDVFTLMQLVMELSRANQESDIKSKRLKAAWSNRKAEAIKNKKSMGKNCPAWLISKDDKYAINKDKAATVKLIYSLYLKGYGIGKIAKQLTKDNVKPISDRKRKTQWDFTIVKHYLNTKAVIGVYEPQAYNDKLKRYAKTGEEHNLFPAIITEAQYELVQAEVKIRGKNFKGNEGTSISNTYGSLLREYKSDVRLMIHSTGSKGEVFKYLISINARTGQSKYDTFPYDVFDSCMRVWIANKRITKDKAKNNQDSTDASELQSKLARLEKRKAEIETQLTDSDGDIATYVNVFNKLNKDIDSIKDEIGKSKVNKVIQDEQEFYYHLYNTSKQWEDEQPIKLEMQRKANSRLYENIYLEYASPTSQTRQVFLYLKLFTGERHLMRLTKKRFNKVTCQAIPIDGKDVETADNMKSSLESMFNRVSKGCKRPYSFDY